VEMRGAPWILWIHDLSQQDPFFILPVLMAVSMFLQTRLNPTPPDPVQAKMMMFMPIAFSVMFFFFPAGLVLYYVVNNVLSIAQQYYITRMMGQSKTEAGGRVSSHRPAQVSSPQQAAKKPPGLRRAAFLMYS
jgi:YidC/Oxa1 family membrane protein insertase